MIKTIAFSISVAVAVTIGGGCASSTDSLAQQWTDSMNSSLREMGESPIVQKSCVQEILDGKSKAEIQKIEDRNTAALEDLSTRIAAICWKMKKK